ncbi:hypothetical protein DFH29DRAFT_1056384 [Suillus ampliporus]|nr:hypothetical protein DFH29DRAFT_1056384 [Suillus ampliporus]
MSELIPRTTPRRVFKDHTDAVWFVAVFPDKRRMVTGSDDMTLRLWDLKTGVMLKRMEGHREKVWRLAISLDGQMIASGSKDGEFIVWHGETGEPLTQPIKAHSDWILTLEFSPDGKVLASGSWDKTTKLWNTKTWKQQGNSIKCDTVRCVRYSPSGEFLAIATSSNIQIHNSDTRECVANVKAHTAWNSSLAWTPDGTRLFSAGDEKDPTIREWDASTWKQLGDPWMGHTNHINAIAVHPAGTHIASASYDNHVRLWRLSDRQTIAIFQHSNVAGCATFSRDGKYIFSGGRDNMISEWKAPKDASPEKALKKPTLKVLSRLFPAPSPSHLAFFNAKAQVSDSRILAINTAARNACIAGDLSTAEEIFTREIDADSSNYTSYANRSFVMAREHDWNRALDDAIKSVVIQPSLAGYISKGIALCGKGQVRDARTAFDLAFMFTNEDSKIIHFLLLVKATVLFGADQHDEAMLLVKELAAACPSNDRLGCHVVEAYLCVQLGINALNGARHDEAAEHFTAAVNSAAFSSTAAIHSIYKDLVVLFGWDLKSLWQNAHQKRCDALRQAGRLEKALKSYQYMMEMSDETTKASCLDWSTGKSSVTLHKLEFSLTFHSAFTQECRILCLANGDAALAASDYDKAIDLYTLLINLSLASDTVFAHRSKASAEKMLWNDALLDAQKVVELNPSSHVGYLLKHTALHGAQRYDEAIEAFQMMLAKLDSAHDMQIRKLREQYVSPSEAEGAIRKVINVQLDTAPLRLLSTATGLLCDREAQISAFKMSTEYNGLLLSLTMKHPDIRMEHITEVVATYFRCVMLSHRWEGKEPLLQDIQDKIVYKLNSLGGIVKLRTFCEIARDAGYRWAWSDTCCIDKSNNVELQESLNSMFVWYRHSALTIVYLSDVPPSSKSGALAKSEWIRRGWTFQEFVAPKVVLFYQKDWSLYLDDRSPNHKESAVIMEELEIRERLQWASTRVTTLQEDVAYSLFGIFGVQLPVIYGEKKQNALGRLLQEIVARSGDITALDWPTFSSYAAPPCALLPLSEDEIQTAVSSLRNTMAVELASKLYDQLDKMSAPRFANCRLHLPCITFRVTELRWRQGPAHQTHFTYGVKADGLRDLLITTEEKLIQFSRTKPAPNRQTFLLVRPWDRRLLEQPDFADDAESLREWPESLSPLDDSRGNSPTEQELCDPESHSRAFQLMVRLGQPFGAFLLAQQRGGEYKRIASDHDIIAQVKDVASAHNMIDIRTLEIL